MSLKFEVKKKHITRSERVKSVELHPDLPWVLSALYSGNITIHDYTTQSIVKTIEVTQNQSPVRNAKFVVRKQWILTVSDDHMVRAFNYNTNEKIKQFEAHTDYIRFILVHPSQPYFLTCSDDTKIKQWDFEFQLVRSFEDHVNYVMMLQFNPRDTNTFASACMDRTIKIWNLNNIKANYTLLGHEGGVNCVDFYKGDRPYIISGGDDRQIKIWDYQTKQCIHTLEAHQQNISGAAFHPDLPLIISTAEDGVVRFWHANTYKLETSLNYNMDRVWCLDIARDNTLAFGFDEGTVVVKIGQDEPIVSMSQGKVVYGKNFEFFTINLKAIQSYGPDGTNVNVSSKDLGISDIYPAGIRHSPNGHMFAVFSDSEFLIYRSQNFKNCGFGQGTDLVWSPNGYYAVRESFSIKIYKESILSYEIKTDFIVEQLYQGQLLGARGSEFVIFYDWDTAKVIRRIDVVPKKIIWNELGTLMALATNEDVYFLSFNQELVQTLAQQEELAEGYEEAFDALYDISENVQSAVWIQDLFYYTTPTGKVAYSIGGKIFQVDTDKKSFIIGYIAQQNRLFLMDKNFNIQSYEIFQQVAEFQSLIFSKQQQKAIELLEQIPAQQHNILAKFLDSLNQKDLAYKLTQDPDHKFELAIQMGFVDEAIVLAKDNLVKLRQVGDLALNQGRIKLAVQALEAADDFGGLLLIYSSLGLKERLLNLGQRALEQTKMNYAFTAFFTCNELDKCIEVLIKSGRYTEAAFFSRTYCPSKISQIVKLWKDSLKKQHPVVAQKIADPFDYPQQFGDLKIGIQIEEFYRQQRSNFKIPVNQYKIFYDKLKKLDLFNKIKNGEVDLSQFQIFQQ